MNLIKNGSIYEGFNFQFPVVDTFHIGFCRIYFSQRKNRGQSLLYYLVVEVENSSNILKKSSEQLLKFGIKGFLVWAVILLTEIIQVGEFKYLYYFSLPNRMDIHYHNYLGIAISG